VVHLAETIAAGEIYARTLLQDCIFRMAFRTPNSRFRNLVTVESLVQMRTFFSVYFIA